MSKKPTIDEIKKQLDDKKIEYKSNLTRDELLKLLEGEKELQEQEVQETESTEKTDDEEQPEEEEKQYVVIEDFKDLLDRNIVYIKDDIYPKRADSEISEERFQELSSDQNKKEKPVIKERG